MGNSANNSSSVKFFSARFRVLVWCCVIVFTRSSQCFKMTTYGSLWCLRHCNCQWARLILPQPRPQILLEWVRALGRGWLFPRTSLLVREKKAVKALCARQAAQCWRALATDVRISGRMSDCPEQIKTTWLVVLGRRYAVEVSSRRNTVAWAKLAKDPLELYS